MPGARFKMKNAAASSACKPSPTSGGCSPSGTTRAADDQSMLEMVAPLLRPHLAAPDRLALFRCSKGLSEAMLQHEQHVRLTLLACGSDPGVAKSSAMHLACRAQSVEVVMHDQVFVPPAELWPRMTTLTLRGISLPGSLLRSRVQSGPSAHLRLRLEGCTLASGGSGGAGTSGAAAFSKSKKDGAGMGKQATEGPVGGGGTGAAGSKSGAGACSPQPAAGSGRTDTSAAPAPLSAYALECIACTPSDNASLRTALSLVNQGQLRELTLSNMLSCPDQATLSGLTALQRLSLQYVSLKDSDLQYFLAHETLTHLTIGDAKWVQNHAAAQPRSLQHILFWYGCNAQCLATLPLAHIKCTVRGELTVDLDGGEPQLAQQLAVLEAKRAKIAAECFPNLSKPPPPPAPRRARVSMAPPPRPPATPPAPLGSTPYPPGNLWHETPPQPSFTLTFPSPYLDSRQHVSVALQQRVLALMTGWLPEGTTLMLYGADPQVVAAIPLSITALGYVNPCECDPGDEYFESDTDDLEALIAATPHHVNCLVVSGWALQSEQVKAIMAGLRPGFNLFIRDLILADIPTCDKRSLKAINKAKGIRRERLVRDLFLGLVNDWAKQPLHNMEVQVVGRFLVCDDF